jgi:hypothetical protein
MDAPACDAGAITVRLGVAARSGNRLVDGSLRESDICHHRSARTLVLLFEGPTGSARQQPICYQRRRLRWSCHVLLDFDGTLRLQPVMEHLERSSMQVGGERAS